MTVDELNARDASGFAAALDGIFEHSPWIVARTFDARPFASVDALHGALLATLSRASVDEQLALLRAHPELAGKAAIARALTPSSTSEQASAGLDACTPAEFAELSALNARYREQFGFPFIIAVRGLDRRQIIAALETRVMRARDVEFREALAQVGRIARLRLEALLS
jgi:2-oxo-4-hydroxy-4-carboxy-5-ureidoimidazoline decarboxylase